MVARVTFGEMVRAVRRRRKWTQAELAERLGCSRQLVSAIETGSAEWSGVARLLSVCDALGLPVTKAARAAAQEEDQK